MNPAPRADLWGGAGLLLTSWLLMASTAAGADDPQAKTEAPMDWPAEIARLQQQVYDHPGLARLRQQLSVACNNYGVILSQRRQWDEAISHLQRARELEASPQVDKNLAMVYVQQASERYEAHQLQEAVTLTERALAIAPDLAEAYAVLGRAEYDRQKLKEAKAAWQKALELNPNINGVAEGLARLNDELPMESKFDRLSQAYFDVRYEDALESAVGFNVRDALLEARRDVGSDFAYWPKHKLVALVYSDQSFRKLRQHTPEWVAGQFDGKIRVPYPGPQMTAEIVNGIVFHEYTHAVIADLGDNRCPLWLNEGLAEYEGRKRAKKPLQGLIKAYQQKRLIPIATLSDSFSTARTPEEVSLAYDQSWSLATYLIDQRSSFWKIRQLLKALTKRQPLEEAIYELYHVKMARFESEWREWLPEQLGIPANPSR